MFVLVELEKELEIPPRFFGPRLREEVERRLREEVEGTCSGLHGFVLAVVEVLSIGHGVVREGSGSAVFKARCRAVAAAPERGEVLDAVVTGVSRMGFFAEAGPLQVFVSSHLIPEDFEHSATGEPSWASLDGQQRIVAGAEVRLRVVGTRVDAAEIFAVGDIKGDYLGVISAPL